jgi:hypothetical protein
VMDGDLADHDPRLWNEVVEHLPGQGDQAQAIATTLLIISSSSECFLVTTALTTTRSLVLYFLFQPHP